MAAWRGLNRFEERSALRTWLYRIATNKCLNQLRASRGAAPPDPSVPLSRWPEPTRAAEPVWLEPYPDALLGDLADSAPGPEARYEARESASLAFVTALQHLPPRQRAVLVLRDVIGFRAAETADILGASTDAVNNLLKRARGAVDARLPVDRDEIPLPGSARERRVSEAFADAFARCDVEAIVGLLTEDAWLSMPPFPLEYQGPETIGRFLDAVSFAHGTRPSRLVPTRANGQPAYGRYLADPHAPVWRGWGLVVLTLRGDRISACTGFLGQGVMERCGLPRVLPPS